MLLGDNFGLFFFHQCKWFCMFLLPSVSFNVTQSIIIENLRTLIWCILLLFHRKVLWVESNKFRWTHSRCSWHDLGVVVLWGVNCGTKLKGARAKWASRCQMTRTKSKLFNQKRRYTLDSCTLRKNQQPIFRHRSWCKSDIFGQKLSIMLHLLYNMLNGYSKNIIEYWKYRPTVHVHILVYYRKLCIFWRDKISVNIS